MMRILLGAQASLPACLGQLAIAGNHAGRDACAPREFRRRKHMLRRLLIAGWLAALFTAFALAQQAGQIVGSVTDNKGAAVANATVKARSEERRVGKERTQSWAEAPTDT